MKKRILAIAVVAGLAAAPLTIASPSTSASVPPGVVASAETGHVVGKLVRKRFKKHLGSWGGGMVQAACEGGGAAIGGLLGASLGPMGMVVGTVLGAS